MGWIFPLLKWFHKFDAPATLFEEGVMEIESHDPTILSRCHFDAKYIYEGTGWKLVGLSVDIK